MSDTYPQSLHCRFTGFPARLRVVCGRAFDAAKATPYVFGSRVVLSQTPLSGQLQGALVPGDALPALEIIHSDTGDDATFDLKLAHYGYGRFYLAAPDDPTLSLAVVKGLRVEAAGINRSFETVDVWTTLIAADTAVADPGTEAAWTQDAAAGDAGSVTWYQGFAPDGAIAITGRLQLGGVVSILF